MRDRPWILISLLAGVTVIVCGIGISIAVIKMAPPPHVRAPDERSSFATRTDLRALIKAAASESVPYQYNGSGSGSGTGRHDPDRPYLQRRESHRSLTVSIAAEPGELNPLLQRLEEQAEEELRRWNPEVTLEPSQSSETELTLNYSASGPAGNYEGVFRIQAQPQTSDHGWKVNGADVTHTLELKIEEERWGIDPREMPR